MEEPGNHRIQFRSNAYIQLKDRRFLNVFNKTYNFESNVRELIGEVLGDSTATVYALSDWYMKKYWSGGDVAQ